MCPNWPSEVENPDKFRCNQKCVGGSKKFSLFPKNTISGIQIPIKRFFLFMTRSALARQKIIIISELKRFVYVGLGQKTLNFGLLAVKNLA